MAEKNGGGWKDEGLDCLVLDEFLLPNPKSKFISENNENQCNVNDNGLIEDGKETKVHKVIVCISQIVPIKLFEYYIISTFKCITNYGFVGRKWCGIKQKRKKQRPK